MLPLHRTKKLPSVTAADVNGDKVDVSELPKDGKIIVLSFWATWCVPCKKELTNIMDEYENWQKAITWNWCSFH
jgi:thiol-disulfide isomerase/thioredoxin